MITPNSAITFTFDEIFPDYASWKEFTNDINLYDLTNPDMENFNKWCFNALIRHFTKQNINYTEPETFLCELANILLDRFMEYHKQKELIDAIYKFTPDEFARVRETLNSQALVNNSKLQDPSVWVGYISAQTYVNDSLSKIDGYLKGIQSMPSYHIEYFISHFKSLFWQFLPNNRFVFPKKGIL